MEDYGDDECGSSPAWQSVTQARGGISFLLVGGKYAEPICLGCGRTGAELDPYKLTCTFCGGKVPLISADNTPAGIAAVGERVDQLHSSAAERTRATAKLESWHDQPPMI